MTAPPITSYCYRMLTHGDEYVRQGMEEYEKKHQARKLQALQKAAESIGLQLVEKQNLAQAVS